MDTVRKFARLILQNLMNVFITELILFLIIVFLNEEYVSFRRTGCLIFLSCLIGGHHYCFLSFLFHSLRSIKHAMKNNSPLCNKLNSKQHQYIYIKPLTDLIISTLILV